MEKNVSKVNQFIAENKQNVNPQYRNAYHLSPPVGWMNDPNGFVYFQGAYHLFYQYYPYDSVWGPMHWGHACTKDLLHWEDLPVALIPEEEYEADGCFSGSAIVKDDKLYLLYTGHVEHDGVRRETQCLAFSEDGLHFEKYTGNPVIGEKELGNAGTVEDFRDPKVFKRGEDYYCVIGSKTNDNRGKVLLFKSENLFDWEFVSILLEGESHQGIVWECPDLFNLDGKDVLIFSPIEMEKANEEFHNLSSAVAFIGEVNWETGKFQTENYHEIDFGMDFYAPQTCEDDQGRRIMVAWMQMWQRNMPTNDLKHGWAGTMTLPRQLHVRNGKLVQSLIPEIYQTLQTDCVLENQVLQNESLELKNYCETNRYTSITLDFSADQTAVVEIKYAKGQEDFLEISYDGQQEELLFSREHCGYPLIGKEKEPLFKRQAKVKLHEQRLVLEIFRDTSTIEIFVNGEVAMSNTFFEKEVGKDLLITGKGQLKIAALQKGRIV